MVRLVVVVDGGLVTDILSDTKDVEVVLCDYDTEGADEEKLMETPHGEMGHHAKWHPMHEPGLVEAWFSRYEKKESEEVKEK